MRAAALALAIASAVISTAVTAEAEEPAPAAVVDREVREARADIDATIVQMRAISLRVRDQLRATRKRGTRAQITCVDQALSRSDVAFRRARETSDEALGAYGRGDLDTGRASRRRLAEIRYSQSIAANEGASCAPLPLQVATAGSTTVKLDIDPKIPQPVTP